MRASLEESWCSDPKSIVMIDRMWPGRFPSTIIRSEILIASDRSCVTKRVVTPLWRMIFAISSETSSRVW